MAKQLPIVAGFRKLVGDIAKGTMSPTELTLNAYYRQPEKAAVLRGALPPKAHQSYEKLGQAIEAINVIVQWQLANGPTLTPAIQTKVTELTGLSEPDGQALYAHLKTTAKGLKRAMKPQGG